MSEPTTYALPAEPEGPVWDKDGRRWTPTDVTGWWLCDVTGVQCTWARLLKGYGPLTTTPLTTKECSTRRRSRGGRHDPA